MLDLMFLAAALALQPPAAAPANVQVLSDCDTSADVVAQVPRSEDMHVIYSIAGAPTCYLVTFKAGSKTMQGFVFDRKLEAVTAFEHSRVEAERDAFSKPIPVPASPSAAPAPSEQAKTVEAKVEKKPAKPAPKVAF